MELAFTIFKYFPYGGIQRDMLQIAQRCAAAGHGVRVYTLRWQGDVPPGIDVIEVPVRGFANHVRYARFARHVQEALARRPADVVVGMNKMPGLDVYFAGDPCFLESARRKRTRLYRLSGRYRRFAEFERAVFGADSATEILTISDVQTPLYQRHYGTADARLHPLPPGIDRSRVAPPDRDAQRQALRSEWGLAADERLVLFLGSGFATKGLDRVLRGLAALPPRLRAASRLFVIGQDRARRYRALARRLGIAERVRFLGGRDDVPRFLFGADLLVLPAYSENTGTAIVEAVVAGLPALVTANCGYAGHVAEADAGCVMPEPFVQPDFDRTLAAMLSDDAALARWRANGIAYGRSADLYSLHDHAARFVIDLAERRRAAIADGGSRRIAPNRAAPPDARALSLWLRTDLAEAIGGRDPWGAILDADGEVFRAQAARCTLRVQWAGRSYFIKRHFGVGWRELAKNLVVGKRPVIDARNEYDACRRLAAAGVGTLTIAGYGAAGRNPARRTSFIVTDELRDHVSLEELCAECACLTTRLRRELVARVAELTRTMHGAGVVHRDYYLCHLLLDRTALSEGRLALSVIDLHRAQVRPHAGQRWVKRDLAALWFSAMDARLSRSDLLRFVRAYTGARPAAVLRARRHFWRSVERRAVRLRRKARRHAQRLPQRAAA